MAQNVTIAGASYPDVPGIDVPKTGGGTARFLDTSDANAQAGDIAQGKTAYVNGTKLTGTNSGSGGGFTPTVLTCTADFADATETDGGIQIDTTLTSGTYAAAQAAALAGTPAVLQITLQETEDGTTTTLGGADIFLQSMDNDGISGGLQLGGSVVTVTLASDGSVRVEMSDAGGGEQPLLIPVTLATVDQLDVIEQQLGEGTWQNAKATLERNTHVELLLTIVANELTLVKAAVPLVKSELDVAAYQAAVEEATQSEQELPSTSSFCALKGEFCSTFDVGLLMNTGVSMPMFVGWCVKLTSDDKLIFTIDQSSQISLNAPLGSRLADDVTIETKTVAQIKADEDVDDIYNLTAAGFNYNLLSLVLQFGVLRGASVTVRFWQDLGQGTSIVAYSTSPSAMTSFGQNGVSDGIERQAWIKTGSNRVIYLFTRGGGNISDFFIS